MEHIDLSFSSILRKALNEDYVKVEKQYGNDYNGIINKCIDRLLFLKVSYDDGKGDKGRKINPATGKPWGNPRGRRRILPFAFYKSKQNGEDTLRAVHWNDSNTKRGPGEWKEFKVSHFKFLTNAGEHFKLEQIPDNANWDGDDHAAELYNIVKKESFEKDTYERRFETKFVTPAEREKMRFNKAEKGESYEDLYTNQTNQQGPVQQLPNIKKGRNLKTMQNLGKPGNIDYKKAYDAFKQSSGRNAFRDWDKAEAERRDQQTQQQRPMSPPQNTAGPVNTRQQPQRQNVNNNEEEDIENYLNNPNTNYSKYKDI
jgi:hypothetical protein